jgi:thioredoxin reductase
MSHYDVTAIGGGAAGLSAALVLSRARRKVVVVDAGEPRNAAAAQMHGYHRLVDLGCDVDADGWVTADPTGATSVPGVWGAGNIIDPRAQVITAAAAIALNADLVDEDVGNAVHDFKHRLALQPTATTHPKEAP